MKELSSLINLAREKGAYCGELARAESAETLQALTEVIKDNIVWCVSKGLTPALLLEYFSQDDLHACDLYLAGEHDLRVEIGERHIVLLGSSSANVETWDSSSANVETWDSSSANVETLGSSSAKTLRLHSSTLEFKVGKHAVLFDRTDSTVVVGEELSVRKTEEVAA